MTTYDLTSNDQLAFDFDGSRTASQLAFDFGEQSLVARLATAPGLVRAGASRWDDGRTPIHPLSMESAYADPELLRDLGARGARFARELGVDVIVGAETAGVPLAASLAMASGLPFAFVRKPGYVGHEPDEPPVRGAEVAGRRVLLVDDAISSGSSVERFAASLASVGAEVVGVFVLVDMSEVADNVSERGRRAPHGVGQHVPSKSSRSPRTTACSTRSPRAHGRRVREPVDRDGRALGSAASGGVTRGFTGANDDRNPEAELMSTTTIPRSASGRSTASGSATPTAAARKSRRCCSTSPWPESVYAFAPMWATLAEHARLFAVDLPGFGASERRDDLLSPRAMGGFLARLIAEADLGTPHIVAPDVGTSAALFAAAAHPERIASVIVGTGGAAVPLELGEPLTSWVLDPDLDKYRRMDPRAIVGVAMDTIAGGVPDEIRADYLDCYDGDRFVESMRYVRRYPEELPAARRAAAADRDTGHDHQRPPRPGRPAGQRRVPRRAACPTAASCSSTPATSSGRSRRRSTPRASSSRSSARAARSSPAPGSGARRAGPCAS